ncbi:MAG: hypothetical protein ACHQVS_03175 [Candidatus Babeliales bacterium]
MRIISCSVLIVLATVKCHAMVSETLDSYEWWRKGRETQLRNALVKFIKLESDAREKLVALDEFVKACENPRYKIKKSSAEIIEKLDIGDGILDGENRVYESVGRSLHYNSGYARLEKRLKSKL